MARKGGNPGTYYKTIGYEGEVAKKTIGVKLPVEIDTWVRSLPNRAEWLREAIAEKYLKEVAQDKKSA